VRDLQGQETGAAERERASAEDWLGKWAINLMLINGLKRGNSAGRALPEGKCSRAGAGVSKFGALAALSRRCRLRA